ncbi:hypothetical protein Tco_0974121 [Tanacetum coccineum]|uniref:Uncharacterized protein n=1 Tax=Tanacetum coccineum TaxID=301880 RepID=A0ABQ5EAQ5_9ASTR
MNNLVTLSHKAENLTQMDSKSALNEEIDKQKLEAHYSYMAKIQEVSLKIQFIVAKGYSRKKLNDTLGLLALKDIEIKEGLNTKAYEILTKSQLEGYLKEETKVISDLKVKEEKDIDKMIEMDKQLKFLNEIVYTRNQSIQTIHMLAPKCSTYNGRPTIANPRYFKKAQSEKPCLYEIPYDTSDLANRFAPNREETMTLANKSRSKLNKDYVKPYGYTKQNIFISWNAQKKLGRQCGENRLLEQNQTLLKTLPFYPFRNPLVKVDKFLTT